MVVVSVGQENGTDWFVNIFDSFANSLPVATRIDYNQVLVSFKIISVFIGDRIHSFMDFHRISSFKEYTTISITQKNKIRNQQESPSTKEGTF
jgi:hypothetical protein